MLGVAPAGISGLRTQATVSGSGAGSSLKSQNSGLRTQVSGLRTQDSGLRTQVSGLKSQSHRHVRGTGELSSQISSK